MTISLRPHVTVTEVDDGLVLLDQGSGRYWHLNATAGRMLRDLLDGHSPEETAARIAGPADDFRTRVTADAHALVDGLRRAKLVAS